MKKSIKTFFGIVIALLVVIQFSIVSYAIEFDSMSESSSSESVTSFEYEQNRSEDATSQPEKENERSGIALFKGLTLLMFFTISLFIYVKNYKNSILIQKLKQQNNSLHTQIEKLTLANDTSKAFNLKSIQLNQELVHSLQFKNESLAMSKEKYESLLRKYDILKIEHDKLLIHFNAEQNRMKSNETFLPEEMQNIDFLLDIYNLEIPSILDLTLTYLNNLKSLTAYKLEFEATHNTGTSKNFFWEWQKYFQNISLNKAYQYISKLNSPVKLKRYFKKA